VLPVFSSPAHETHFQRDGYVVISGFAAEVIEETEGMFWRTAHDQVQEGFHHTLELDLEVRAQVHAFLTERYAQKLREVVPAFRSVFSVFVSKGRGDDGLVWPHQDSSFVDERTARSLNVWIPLTDTTAKNGALGVVKGTQRLPHTIRGTNVNPEMLSPDQVAPYLTLLPMRAGDAVIYDHRVVHTSAPNRSQCVRAAISMHLVPDDAKLVRYYGTPAADAVLELEVDPAFFVTHRLDDPPDLSRYPHRIVPFVPVNIGPSELAALDPTRLPLRRVARSILRTRLASRSKH
jgi:Phytanoyl-CoA dioxygenase (PhyH)